MFWQQTKQVALTYLTQRWLWLILGLILLMTCVSYAAVRAELMATGFMPGLWAMNGLGFPIGVGMTWLMMVAKWQFANPRARLLPKFGLPHLSLLAMLFTLILIVNPICFSLVCDRSMLGCIACALIFGGILIWETQPGRFFLALPGIAIFFTGMTEAGRQFWFATPNRFDALHGALAITGGAMVIGWLWHLSRLTEEMDDYQVRPMGWAGGFSRIERAEQRKFVGRVMARRSIMQTLADRWHDQLARLPANPQRRPRLMHYGFGRISGVARAFLAGLGFALYALFMNLLYFSQDGGPGPASGMMLMTVAIPALMAGWLMMQRLPRMAHELLWPATRAEYIHDLFLATAKQSLWMWVAIQIPILAIVMSTGALADENRPVLVVSYLLVSLAAQLPAFGFCLWIIRKFSVWRLFLGLYAVMFFQILVLGVWWAGRKECGDLLVVAIIIVVLLALGAKMIAWARRAWLQLELG
jgi:hypothetical protein